MIITIRKHDAHDELFEVEVDDGQLFEECTAQEVDSVVRKLIGLRPMGRPKKGRKERVQAENFGIGVE